MHVDWLVKNSMNNRGFHGTPTQPGTYLLTQPQLPLQLREMWPELVQELGSEAWTPHDCLPFWEADFIYLLSFSSGICQQHINRLIQQR
jgi:hypothetical protein